MPKNDSLNRNFFRRGFPYDDEGVDEVTGSPKGLLVSAPALAEAAKILGKPTEKAVEALAVPGMVKEGYQELSKAAGMSVSTPEEEEANRQLFKSDPVTGDTQAAIADFKEHPNFTNFFGMPLAAIGMVDKVGETGLVKAGVPHAIAAPTSAILSPTNFLPTAAAKFAKLKELTMTPEILKLFEAAKGIGVTAKEAAAAREVIATNESLRAMQAANEAGAAPKAGRIGDSIRNQVKAAQKAKAPKPDVVGSSLRNRAVAEGKVAAPKSVPIPETEFTPRDRFNIENRQFAEESKAAAARMQEPLVQPQWEPAQKGQGSELSLTREGDVITGQSPRPSPSPSPAGQAPATPVITAPEPLPATSPVATPSIAEETAGLEAKQPGFFGRFAANNPKTTKALIGGAALGGAGAVYGLGKDAQLKNDQAMIDKTAWYKPVQPPVGGVPGVPAPTQGEPPPPTGPAALVPKAPSEQDIYNDEVQRIQTAGIENLNDAANTVATAREASVDPQVAARQQEIQDAIGGVGKASEEKVPERAGHENLGLILATLGGALSGDTQAPVRLSETIRQGQRQRIGDLQSGAEQKLRASQLGLEATLAGSRERLQRGEQKVGDVMKIAELRDQASKLALAAQKELDPRKRSQLEAQIALINSEIAKNRGSASYYESGSKVNKTIAETERIKMENERNAMLNERIRQSLQKSPNRPSAGK